MTFKWGVLKDVLERMCSKKMRLQFESSFEILERVSKSWALTPFDWPVGQDRENTWVGFLKIGLFNDILEMEGC